MLDSERSQTNSENEKNLVDNNNSNETNHIKEEVGGDVGGESGTAGTADTDHKEGTPSLSSSSPKQQPSKEEENGNAAAAVKDEGGQDEEGSGNDTAKINGAQAGVRDAESMEVDPEPKIKQEESSGDGDVTMEDASTAVTTNTQVKKGVITTSKENNKNDKNNELQNKQSAPKSQQQQQQSTSTTGAEEEKKTDGEKSKAGDTSSKSGDKSNNNSAAAPAAAPASSNPPPPVLKGTLSYNLDLRRHIIRGMWNYENSNSLPPQRFELLRTLDKTEDPKELPKDGEFHGSFSLAYFHTTSKGKQKERSKVITEQNVKITFTKMEDNEKEYKVDGTGTNQFGVFHINGTATPSQHEGDPCYDIVLRKRYEPSEQPPERAGNDADRSAATGASKKRKSVTESGGDGPLPPPSNSFPNGVVCLRGKLYKEDAEDLGATDVAHRINGMWASGLDFILADPQNVQGHCNRFEYEHKSTVPTSVFPVSGRYSGWFHVTAPDGKRATISERDVVLRFTKNNAGYHNVEGRGTNVYGKYTITGTLSMDNVITIFRHFKPIKVKTKAHSVTSAPPPINKGGQSATRRPTLSAFPEPRLTLDEVEVPGGDNGEALSPIVPPANTSYSAVSQGVLRLNEDGSHQCTGKWAVTREHLTNGQTSPFNFRLEPHYALDAVNEKKKKEGLDVEGSTTAAGTPNIPQDFPLDSALYKGSFQLKKKGTRYETILDQQIVMKFRKSTSGAYNVYGRGVNGIGIFNLVGTLIMRGKTGGQVELYRMYPPELLTTKQAEAPAAVSGKQPVFPKSAPAADPAPLPGTALPQTQLLPSSSTILPGPPRGSLVRRESSRLVKLPSRLEDDDPRAQLARIMEKCVVILRQIREKDIERGAFFSEPVDPVALGIPTYRQVIAEPMDLGTVARRLDANQIDTPEEFARLVRLTFENAITFNVDPNHSVHVAARYLLVEFNKKFRDIERMLETLRRVHKGTEIVDDKGKKKKKDDKKRKRGPDEPKSAKRRRLDEALAMAAENAQAMAAITAAAPQTNPNAAVSRGEWNMMIHMIQLLQKQIVQTHNAIAELSPGDEAENAAAAISATATAAPSFDTYASLSAPETTAAPAPAPERKKTKKKASEPAPKKVVEEPAPEPTVYDDLTKPLTLQEQEILTDTINNMPPDHIPGVIQIIRESASLNGDEDEIDLEIDQLDTVTQRKLLRHVSKYIKQPKRTKNKTTKKSKAAASAPAPAPAPAPTTSQKKTEKPPAKKPASPKKSDPGSFFAAFGSGKGDSESESDDDEPPAKQTVSTTPSGGKHFASAAASSKSDGFDLGDGFSGLHDDNDDDLGNGGITANWNISKAVAKNAKEEGGGDDDDWGAAREAAAAEEARQADRKAREEKLKAEAEEAKKERLLAAAAEGEKLKAKRLEEEEMEAKRRAEKEKEEKDAIEEARRKMREQVGSVEQTVDLDAQRDIMKQYEQSFLDKELGSASPSSDFGF